MGKVKAAAAKEKKFDRNVEISAPILDPEIIKAIHTPPKGQRLDIRHGGFKALLSDLNSQDSTDEMVPIVDSHVPSYIGISCAVSGYSNYSSYNRRPLENTNQSATKSLAKRVASPNRSVTSSPIAFSRSEQHQVNHITIDRSNINCVDDERRELTEKLTASATERRRSPTPLPPIEDDRHHGAYVGARYCPLPPPSKLVHKHIPLLGIDDDQDPDEVQADDVNKVEKKIATLYGDEFVEDWRESMSHKAKKEHSEDQSGSNNRATVIKCPKDLVTLKSTPARKEEPPKADFESFVETPNVKVLAGVEKQFLNKLLTDENPPMPKSPSPQPTSPTHSVRVASGQTPPISPSPPSPSRDAGVFNAPPSQARPTDDSVSAPTSNDTVVATDNKEPLIELNSPVSQSPEPVAVTAAQPDKVVLAASSIENDDLDLMAPHSLSPPPQQHQKPPAASSVEEAVNRHENEDDDDDEQSDYDDQHSQSPPLNSPEPRVPQTMSPDSGKSQSIAEGATAPEDRPEMPIQEEHIEYEIRTQSPLDNQSSPVRQIDCSGPESLVVMDSQSISREQLEIKAVSPENERHPSSLEIDRVVASDVGVSSNVNQTDSSELTTNESLAPTENDAQVAIGDENDRAEQQPACESASQKEENAGKEQEEEKEESSAGQYYLDLLEQEKSFILSQVKRAECMLAEHEFELDGDTAGRIRSAIGKANLLINKKCNQFEELCERSINRGANEQYAVLNDDLAGFWDMISIQISDVRKSLETL